MDKIIGSRRGVVSKSPGLRRFKGDNGCDQFIAKEAKRLAKTHGNKEPTVDLP